MDKLICVIFSLPPGVGGWLRLLLVSLPGLFYLPFFLTGDMGYFICFIGHRSFTQGNRQSEKVTTLTAAAEEEETTTEASHWNGQ